MKNNQENSNIFQMDSTLPPTLMAETLLPLYQSPVNKADSGLTYNIPTTRKRPRESIMGHDSNANFIVQKTKPSGVCAFLDIDIISQIYQQQSEIDRFIAHHVILFLSFFLFKKTEALNWVFRFPCGISSFFFSPDFC